MSLVVLPSIFSDATPSCASSARCGTRHRSFSESAHTFFAPFAEKGRRHAWAHLPRLALLEPITADRPHCPETLTAFEIKDAVYEKFGFTVNIGISVNHLLAKMASDFEKPNRVHTLFPEEMAAKFWPLPVESLYGCGKTTAKRLRSLGITTIGALAKADRQMLLSNFKSQGDYLWESANGISSSAVTAESPANKGYGNSVTLPYDVTDTENAHHILLSLCETVGARIRYDKAYISVVQVQIVDNDFHHRCKQLSLPSATNVTEKIYEAACNAFDQGWDHAPIRLLGVSTSKATDESYEQYNLFDQDKFERLSKLNSAIDKIRDKYGDDAIVRACFADTHKN